MSPFFSDNILLNLFQAVHSRARAMTGVPIGLKAVFGTVVMQITPSQDID